MTFISSRMSGSARLATFLLLAGGLANGSLVQAAEAEPSSDEIMAILPTSINADDDRGPGHGSGIRLVYGRKLAPRWYWETDVFGAVLETGDSTISDFYQLGAATGLSWSLYERSVDQWTPYVLGTVGLVENDIVPEDDEGFGATFAVGIGAVSGSLFDNGLKARAEVRYLFDSFQKDYGDAHFSLGLEIPLGRVRTIEKIVYVNREVPVEKFIEVERLVDAPDSDGDSVPDSRDDCPKTLAGARVDARGCIIESQTLTLSAISFELGSDRLTFSSRQALKPIAQSLQSQEDIQVEIGGHTDSQGSAEFNQNLSQKRAESVRRFLVEQGVQADRLTAVGYGEMQPVADNDTVSGRAMNRRVEFKLIK